MSDSSSFMCFLRLVFSFFRESMFSFGAKLLESSSSCVRPLDLLSKGYKMIIPVRNKFLIFESDLFELEKSLLFFPFR